MKSIALLALSLTAGAAPVVAQQRPESRFQAATPVQVAPAFQTLPAAAQPHMSTSRVDAANAEAASSRSRGFFSFGSLARLVGGALVGGWVGYVGAQVAHSDWDKETDGSLKGQRSTWVAGGMVAGMIGSRFVGGAGTPQPGPLTPTRSTGRNVLTRAEIERSPVSNAYDLIQSLRREWLITRGTDSPTETTGGELGGNPRAPTGVIVEGRPQIVVYINGSRMGGIDALRDVAAHILTGAEFLDARQATLRYGAGHNHGAILLFTDTTEQ